MKKSALQSTAKFYEIFLGDIIILVFSLIGASIAYYFDIFRLTNRLDNVLVIGLYTLLAVMLSFPISILVNLIRSVIEKPKFRVEPSERNDEGVPYIGAVITNADRNSLLKCYCVLKSIKFNGRINEEMKYQITQHTDRISWSGGSDENIGIKYIDAENMGELNLASLRGIGTLVFETAKGQRGKNLSTGTYEIELMVNGKIGDNDLRKKSFNISFEYLFEGEQTSVPFHGNILSGKLGNYRVRLLGKKSRRQP